MDEHARTASGTNAFPARLHVTPALTERNRMTTGFRVILAIPHLVLVGGPMAAAFWWGWNPENGAGEWAAGGGALGAVAVVCAFISWLSIIATGKQPSGLWSLTSFYLRWRVKAVGYAALLTDMYPPFGEGEYPTNLRITAPVGERNRPQTGRQRASSDQRRKTEV